MRIGFRHAVPLMTGWLAACSSHPQPAVLDDVARGARCACYTIAKVDGHQPLRRRGRIVTYVPFVLVSEGEHVLELALDSPALLSEEQRAWELDQTVELRVTVAAGRRYHLAMDGRTVQLVSEK